MWELADQPIGFSSVDAIVFGESAFMHLHILAASQRQVGLGTRLVRDSATHYFRVLELQRLYCQPNAYNVAPNRTLQSAGFRYQLTHYASPSAINFPQPLTRWVLDRPQ